MKTRLSLLSIILIIFSSCMQDNENQNIPSENSDTIIENSVPDTTLQQVESDTQSTVNNSKTQNTKATNTTSDKAEDIDSKISTKINKANNPDNQNGNYDPSSEKSNISIIPILNEADKAFYYVQIAESPTKFGKSYFDTFFKSKQDVYVMAEGGVFKYCIGKYKTREEAEAYQKEVKQKYRFKKCSVETFSQGW